jgi:hypothetical protein
MEVSGDKKSKRICLDVSPLFFLIVSKLVQALVVRYYEIFQALVAEGHVRLLKPFLDSTPTPYSPDSAPLDFHVFGKLKKTSPEV